MTTIVVSIGRNIGDEPMDAEQWLRFRGRVYDAVALRDFVVVFEGEGTGTYEGQREPSFTLVATGKNNRITGLYYAMEDLASEFGQKSIALTTGNTSFPGSREA